MVKDADDLPPKFTESIYRTKINEFSPITVSIWISLTISHFQNSFSAVQPMQGVVVTTIYSMEIVFVGPLILLFSFCSFYSQFRQNQMKMCNMLREKRKSNWLFCIYNYLMLRSIATIGSDVIKWNVKFIVALHLAEMAALFLISFLFFCSLFPIFKLNTKWYVCNNELIVASHTLAITHPHSHIM